MNRKNSIIFSIRMSDVVVYYADYRVGSTVMSKRIKFISADFEHLGDRGGEIMFTNNQNLPFEWTFLSIMRRKILYET